MNMFGQLPSELISLILDHVHIHDLYACTFINKRFYTETMPLLWQQVDIESEVALNTIIRTVATSLHSSPGDHVRSLTITIDNISDDELLMLIQHMPQLAHLQLTNADHISDTSFQHVPLLCPHLTTLYIQFADRITATSMSVLGRHCHQLEALTIEKCYALNISIVAGALQHCPLKELTIIQCNANAMVTQDTCLAVAGFQHLTTLTLQNFLTDYSPILALNNNPWPHLTHLSLATCMQLNDDQAIQFIQAHPQLTCLNLRKNYYLTDRTLDAIITYLPKVKEVSLISLRRLTPRGLWRLVQQCPDLVNGVTCVGCEIFVHDDDFPVDLDSRFYKLAEEGNQASQVVWFGNVKTADE